MDVRMLSEANVADYNRMADAWARERAALRLVRKPRVKKRREPAFGRPEPIVQPLVF